jgi:hypothetical protein
VSAPLVTIAAFIVGTVPLAVIGAAYTLLAWHCRRRLAAARCCCCGWASRYRWDTSVTAMRAAGVVLRFVVAAQVVAAVQRRTCGDRPYR